jgi:hypothetical protein
MKLLSIILLFAFNSCDSSSTKNRLTCDELNIETTELIDRYYVTDDKTYIDSTLILLNEGIKSCDDYRKLFSLRKLGVLSLKNDYEQAISFIDTIDESLFVSDPYYLEVIEFRFKAAQHFYHGDTVSANYYLKKIVALLGNFLKENEKELNALLSQGEISIILQNEMSTAFIQHANYHALLNGREITANHINTMFKSNEWNMEFYDMILNFIDNEDILIFMGI